MADLWEADVLGGTAIAYAIDASGTIDIEPADYEVDRRIETYPEQLRWVRKSLVKAAVNPPTLPLEALDRETVVLVGPNVSPRAAVRALMRVARSIRDAGLVIGRDPDGAFKYESFKSR